MSKYALVEMVLDNPSVGILSIGDKNTMLQFGANMLKDDLSYSDEVASDFLQNEVYISEDNVYMLSVVEAPEETKSIPN